MWSSGVRVRVGAQGLNMLITELSVASHGFFMYSIAALTVNTQLVARGDEIKVTFPVDVQQCNQVQKVVFCCRGIGNTSVTSCKGNTHTQ